jgi:hypothetical protein
LRCVEGVPEGLREMKESDDAEPFAAAMRAVN